MFTSIPPWYDYVKKVELFFKKDPDIYIEFNCASYVLDIYTNNQFKAAALQYLLPTYVNFETAEIDININNTSDEKAYNSEYMTPYGHLSQLAQDNPIFVSVNLNEFINITEVIFSAEIIQYGENKSTLYEDIARELFCPNNDIQYYTETFNS